MKHKTVTIFTLILLLLICLLFRKENIFPFLLSAVVLIYLGIIIYGSSQIKANYFLNSINIGDADAISFTFDDGPDVEMTPKILDLLEWEKIKATFFVIGKKAEANKNVLEQMDKGGHTIANHSYNHSNLIGFFSKKHLMDDIEKCSTIIENIIGKKPIFFRPPFGVTNPKYAKVLKKLGLTSIGWSIRSFDTVEKNKEKLFSKIKDNLTKGSIILFHDTQKITLEILPDIINYCRQQNIRIVSLPELIGQNPYKNV